MAKKKKQSNSHLFFAPIDGLQIDRKLNQELRIDQVTFVSSDKLPRIRNRLGISQPLSEIRKKHSWLDSLFDSPTIAYLWLKGDPQDTRNRCLVLVQQELDILSVSQLGWRRRHRNSYPRIQGARTGAVLSTTHFNSQGDLANIHMSQQIRDLIPFSIDGMWRDYHRKVGPFFNLLKIIRGERKVQKSWKQILKRVAILIGKSQYSKDISHAFLLNMIALEMLLIGDGDKYKTEMPKRVHAFLDWTLHSTGETYSDQIESLYKKRCDLVHEGKADGITIPDLLTSDHLVFNVLNNLVRHHSLFASKHNVIEFSRKVEAEALLGLKDTIRPKTFTHISRKYSEDDYTFI